MKINVPFRRKDVEIEAEPCMVEKTVELPADLFAYFSRNLLDDYDFILENIDCMYQDKDGVNHCLLVLGEGQDDGILVESEGNSYARRSAFVPNVRQLWQQQMAYDPVLTEFCEKMQSAADGIVRDALQQHQDGMYRVLIDDINLNLGDLPGSMEFLYEMLRNRPELAEMQDFRDEIFLQLKPEYIPAEEKEYRHLTEEQINVMCAKHLLWLYDEGGEQADFSDCALTDINLSHRNLNNAVFAGAKLCGTALQETELCFADFTGAHMDGCNARNITADEAIFKDAVIRNCDFSGALMMHCNFSGADLTGTTMKNARMQNACFDRAKVPDSVFEQADVRNYSTDEQDWSEPSDPVLSM